MLYHSEIHLPKRIRNLAPQGKLTLRYSWHAIEASHNDRYGQFKLPETVNLADCQIVEMETRERSERADVAKIVARMSVGNGYDLCIVINPIEKHIWNVKTVWVNRADDLHKTLDPTPYAKAG